MLSASVSQAVAFSLVSSEKKLVKSREKMLLFFWLKAVQSANFSKFDRFEPKSPLF